MHAFRLLLALANAAHVSASWAAIKNTGVVKGYSKVFQEKPPVSTCPLLSKSGCAYMDQSQRLTLSFSGISGVHGGQHRQPERPGTQQGYVASILSFFFFSLSFFVPSFLFSLSPVPFALFASPRPISSAPFAFPISCWCRPGLSFAFSLSLSLSNMMSYRRV